MLERVRLSDIPEAKKPRSIPISNGKDAGQSIEAQEHQRFLKSHLPFDALPYDPAVRYVYVGRDTRDVFMSAFNHYSAYTTCMPIGGMSFGFLFLTLTCAKAPRLASESARWREG